MGTGIGSLIVGWLTCAQTQQRSSMTVSNIIGCLESTIGAHGSVLAMLVGGSEEDAGYVSWSVLLSPGKKNMMVSHPLLLVAKIWQHGRLSIHLLPPLL